jgi:hypothetical protein
MAGQIGNIYLSDKFVRRRKLDITIMQNLRRQKEVPADEEFIEQYVAAHASTDALIARTIY